MQLDDFRALDDTRITPELVAAAATGLAVGPAKLWAVIDVESNGRGFRPDKLVTMRREAHIARSKYGFHSIGGDPNSYDLFMQDLERNEDATLLSASYGMFQIMGFNHGACRVGSVRLFVELMRASEASQLNLFCQYVRSSYNGRTLEALRNGDWAQFASDYNGTGYRANAYDEKLAERYIARLNWLAAGGKPARPVLRKGSNSQETLELQRLLNKVHGAQPVYEDGIFGPGTEDAVVDFQRAYFLVADGVVGERTWAKLEELARG
jgi:hypothetical protein